jgi:hypothetical protein
VAVVKAGVRTALFVPMLRNDELVGSFSIGRRRIEHFTENEIELVTDFAAQAAIALEPTKNACRHRCAEGAGVTETVGELTFTTRGTGRAHRSTSTQTLKVRFRGILDFG